MTAYTRRTKPSAALLITSSIIWPRSRRGWLECRRSRTGGTPRPQPRQPTSPPFTPEDLDEARSRLTRLAQVLNVRLRALTDEELDRCLADAWSPRQIAFHLEESLYYAHAVGNLRG
jgi:hypothetical protein